MDHTAHGDPEGDVLLVRADDLSDQTPQTVGLQRFEAVSARRLGSNDREGHAFGPAGLVDGGTRHV